MQVTIGLYRHFKGDYFYVQNLSKNKGQHFVSYFNVLHPEYGLFTRTIEDFTAVSDIHEQFGDTIEIHIKDRNDNVTGQIHRFEKIVSLDNEVKNLSTQTLINELAKREDSPLQKLDIKGVSDLVFCTDYIVGNKYEATEDYPKGVETVSTFDTEEEAKNYFSTHNHRKDTKVFKRTFIEVK